MGNAGGTGLTSFGHQQNDYRYGNSTTSCTKSGKVEKATAKVLDLGDYSDLVKGFGKFILTLKVKLQTF
jgi:hypothetical protein